MSTDSVTDFDIAISVLEDGHEKLIKDAIGHELLTEYEEGVDWLISETADRVRQAVDALSQPENELQGLRNELQEIGQKTRQLAAQRDTARLAEDRVGARLRYEAWLDEEKLLREKIALAENDLQVLYDARNEAVNTAQQALMGKANLMAAVADPFRHSLAFGTKTFQMYRDRIVWKTFLLGDRKSPLWDEAIDQLRTWAEMTGWRSESDPLIDSDADAQRNLWEHYRNEKLERATTQPSAMDVIHAQETVIRRSAEDSRWNARVEDLRGIRKPPNRDSLVPPEKRVNLGEYRRT